MQSAAQLRRCEHLIITAAQHLIVCLCKKHIYNLFGSRSTALFMLSFALFTRRRLSERKTVRKDRPIPGSAVDWETVHLSGKSNKYKSLALCGLPVGIWDEDV